MLVYTWNYWWCVGAYNGAQHQELRVPSQAPLERNDIGSITAAMYIREYPLIGWILCLAASACTLYSCYSAAEQALDATVKCFRWA